MSKPSSSLLVDVMLDWCCSHHFSDCGIPDPVTSGLVDGSSEAPHLTSGDLAFKGLCQGPRLALIRQGGSEDGINELGFRFCGDIWMF